MSDWKESANKRREHRQAPVDCRKQPGKKKNRKNLQIVVMCKMEWLSKATTRPVFRAKSMEEAERWMASTQRRHAWSIANYRRTFWIEDAKS